MFTHFSSFSPNTLLVLFFIFFFGYFDGKREEEGDIIDLKSLYCLECFFFVDNETDATSLTCMSSNDSKFSDARTKVTV